MRCAKITFVNKQSPVTLCHGKQAGLRVRCCRDRPVEHRKIRGIHMKLVKGLILGSAASLLSIGAAAAADLPVKAKAVEYVRICSAYGAGFWYIPGTDTCMKIGGYFRADVTFNGSIHGQPAWSGDLGQQNRYRDYFTDRARMAL